MSADKVQKGTHEYSLPTLQRMKYAVKHNFRLTMCNETRNEETQNIEILTFIVF